MSIFPHKDIMKILFITSRLPYPPDRGDRLRAYNFLRAFSREHSVALLSFTESKEENQRISSFQALCSRIEIVTLPGWQSKLNVLVYGMWSRTPLQVLYYRSRKFQVLLDKMVNEFCPDIIFVHLFRVAPYIEKYSHLYRVIDFTDVISSEIKQSLCYRSFFWRMLYRIEGKRIKRIESYLADTLNESWVISTFERDKLRALSSASQIVVIPNGIDQDRFFPANKVQKQEGLVIFVGHMGGYHNSDAVCYFIDDILPKIREMVPNVRFRVVGPCIEGFQSQVKSVSYNVEFAGYTDDLNPELNRAIVFVAPLRFAAGIQNKILEAMVVGLPVVTTSCGNSGLQAEHGKEIFVEDTPDHFAERVAELLRDEELRKKIGFAGREFVISRFSWDQSTQRLVKVSKLLTERITDNIT